MDSVCKAVEILQVAEGGLRQLMQEDIGRGRYSELPVLASLADGVSVLLGKAKVSTGNKPSEDTISVSPDLESTKPDARRRVPSSEPPTKSRKKHPKYPYFETGEDWISKVGWSKKNREEYRHYAPKSAAFAFAGHIDKTQGPGRVWSVDDLGEVMDFEAAEALPSYQLYLIIAWMRSVDLLAKQGRSGYVAVGGGKLLPGVKKFLGSA